MLIDLRSDTVTKPTAAMRDAMFSAPLGDDVFEEDPSVNELEAFAADLFGKEAALYCPSGTMTNQIAVKLHTQPGDEMICDRLCHIYNYEGGGAAFNSGISMRLVEGDRGRINPQLVTSNINPDNVHFPNTSLVSIENTSNRGGGCYYQPGEMAAIAAACKEAGLPLHMDGARLFNALVETGETTREVGALLDTISVCLSKGLGAPVGSVLLGTKAHIKRARRIRKVFGGGMRQAGLLAAAGTYALKHHVERLREDHTRAKELANVLSEQAYVTDILPVVTNIVVYSVAADVDVNAYLEKLEEQGLRAVPFGPQTVRLVTHLNVDDRQLEAAAVILKSVL